MPSKETSMKKTLILVCSVSLLAGVATAQTPRKTAPLGADAATASKPKNVTIAEAEKLLQKNKQIIVLDVRTPEEFKAGHIPGAVNVDFYDKGFAQNVAKLDKGRTYLVHCAAGGRSAKASTLMQEQKFQSLYHLPEGFRAWEKAGKPVEK